MDSDGRSNQTSQTGNQKGRTDDDASALAATGLAGLGWDNRFIDQLPVDPSPVVRPRQVTHAMSSRVQPVSAAAPTVVAWSSEMSDALAIPGNAWTDHEQLMAQVFSGSRLLPGMDPHAACYGGHQFGNWAGQLGDGRAISLGEVVTEDHGHLTLQLKGAGPTPYSRSADGMAVLRSSLREFICSEAMHHLGIATTRALSLILTGDKVVRDMFYDGNPEPEPGAVVCRVAPSFIRFGNFQIFAARQELDELRQLTDFTIGHYFPQLLEAHEPGSNALYEALFAEVSTTTREMITGWMRVGFVHGVMNTDNMSIHGATIDYGPYGWLEDFDPGWTPNTTDAGHRRYRYGQQPQIGQWNLMQLANALVQLTQDPEPLQQTLEDYGRLYTSADQSMWLTKLGLSPADGDDASEEQRTLITDLHELLMTSETDMSLFFRALAEVPCSGAAELTDEQLVAPLAGSYYLDGAAEQLTAPTAAWIRRYGAMTGNDDGERAQAMNRVNPLYVARNYLAQLAIDAAEADDFGPVMELLDVLRRPYTEQPGRERFAEKRPEWARQRPGCSQLSCSS